MLTRIQPTTLEPNTENKNPQVRIANAGFPAVFPHTLEFNPPAHGSWNIVHIGMNVPEAHQIYICAINCMRGVILTAAEMNASDRFSFVILKEEDMVEGTVEEITIEGIKDVLRRLPKLPPAVLVFPVCTHHFLGCDMKRIYTELEDEFPQIDFIHGWMDPIMQKEGPTPDQKLREHMYDVLPKLEPKAEKIAIIGGNVSLAKSSDVYKIAELAGMQLIQMPDCETYEEYQKLGEAALFLGFVPNSQRALKRIGKRLNRQALYLPMTFDYEENEAQLKVLFQSFVESVPEIESNTSNPDSSIFCKLLSYIETKKQEINIKAEHLLDLIGQSPIAIDYTVHPRPLGLARFLLERGFRVERIYLNAINPEEKAAYLWLQEYAPDLLLTGTIQPECRVSRRCSREKLLAIGQQAAWFSGTSYFVNMVEGGSLQGFDGISRMLDEIEAAWKTEKDTRDLIPRKGLGCESCV